MNHKFKIDPGMLPQSQALEGRSVDKSGQTRNGACRDASDQHCQREIGESQRNGGSASDSQTSGVSRVFVVDRRGGCAPLGTLERNRNLKSLMNRPLRSVVFRL